MKNKFTNRKYYSPKKKKILLECGNIKEDFLKNHISCYDDENGIIWPRAIAPFEVVVVPVNAKVPEQLKLAENIYEELKSKKIDVLLDDRKERAGIKFKDADLIGYPLRITVGPKAIENDKIEVRIRRTGEIKEFDKTDYLENVIELLNTI